MTDITQHNAKIHVHGVVATNTTNPVAVVIPQLGVLEGATVSVKAANAVAVKTAVSGITLTTTPAANPGSGYYEIHAWGY